jgi:FKBP-type peptidyl-prolyl cis-trans isomerase
VKRLICKGNNVNKILCSVALVLFVTACSQDQKPEAKQVSLDSDKAKLGYVMGLDAGLFFQQMQGDADADAFIEALKTTVNGGAVRMGPEEVVKVKQAFMAQQQKKQEEQVAKMAADAAANKETGEAFLAANKQREGIVTTQSGLQYEVITPANGNKPKATDTVKVHYRGTLIDGTEFDSSIARGEPLTFPLNRVIPGWAEGVQLMSVGSKYRFYVPSDLAYGPRGAGAKIGPNSALIFEVELLEIVKSQEKSPAK